MRKIRLDLQDLHVDSFTVTSELKGRIGTVLARSETYTLPIPYSLCTSGTDVQDCQQNPTAVELGTCNHTVCDCDQDGWTADC